MEAFIYAASAARVVFGSGTLAQLGEEAAALGIARAMVVATGDLQGHATATEAALGERAALVFPGAVMHTPMSVTADALAEAVASGVDGFVSVGGGSAIGLGKALSLRTGLPHIAVPTTYAGSEMTPLLGQTEDGVKTTIRDPKVLPATVLYDVDLTLGLPTRMSGVSGLNAIAHAVEALYSPAVDPILLLMAEEGIRSLYAALPAIIADPGDSGPRADAMYGAWLCATCLGRGSVALHHKLCHVLGGTFNLPHAETHAIVLPHALAYNEPEIPGTMARLRRALGRNDPALALFELTAAFGASTALRDLGMPEAGIDRTVAMALADPYRNPRPLEEAALRNLVSNAWLGLPPGSGYRRQAA